jgi:hypothetical protein
MPKHDIHRGRVVHNANFCCSRRSRFEEVLQLGVDGIGRHVEDIGYDATSCDNERRAYRERLSPERSRCDQVGGQASLNAGVEGSDADGMKGR